MWDVKLALIKATATIHTCPDEELNSICDMIADAIVVDSIKLSNAGRFEGPHLCKLDIKSQSTSNMETYLEKSPIYILIQTYSCTVYKRSRFRSK